MPIPIPALVLGGIGAFMLLTKKGKTESGGLTVNQNSTEAEKIYAKAMSLGTSADAATLEKYAQQCDKLGRTDLGYHLRQQMMLSTPEGRALKIYETAMSQQNRLDVGLLETYAQQIDSLGVRPDLAAALRAQKAAVLKGIGK